MTLRSGGWFAGAVLLGAFLLPVWVVYAREPFVLDVVTRLMILAIAASSLNLILGYSGMVSLGHAVFLGIGAYAAGIPAYYELNNGWLQLATALGASGLFALLTGLVCLRTRGAYFIMITLAFAQMMYFIFVSIEEYGGDDGLVIYSRSEMGFGVDLNDNVQLYFLVLFCLAAVLGFMHRLTQSDFGQVIRSIKINEPRMQALGFATFQYRLVCYVISGMVCGLAGWLLGNFTGFISPEMMDWTRSGELIAMVLLGGAATVAGPLVGAGIFIGVETLLPDFTVYWHLYLGILLIIVAKFGRGGLLGWWTQWRKDPR